MLENSPISFAGTAVADHMASCTGIPNQIAFLMQSKMFVTDPTIVPAENVAKFPFTKTSCPQEYKNHHLIR